MLLSSIVLLLCISFANAAGLKPGDCKKCDSEILQITEQHINNLSYTEITNFLCSLNESCVNNVEFSEASNELLFRVFFNEPKLSLKSLSDNRDVSLNFILKQLSEPVNDGIDLKGLHSKMSRVKGYGRLKEKIMHSLQEAINKNK